MVGHLLLDVVRDPGGIGRRLEADHAATAADAHEGQRRAHHESDEGEQGDQDQRFHEAGSLPVPLDR